MWQNSKTQKVRKLKNSNGDKTKKNQIVTKLKNLNCDKTKKNQIVTKLKKSNCDKSRIVTTLKLWLDIWQISNYEQKT